MLRNTILVAENKTVSLNVIFTDFGFMLLTSCPFTFLLQ